MSKNRRRKAVPAALATKTPARRSYEGATVSRLTADWVTSSTSADAEINSSLVRLRNRARQLVRDNAYARQTLRAIANNVVGTGIRLQAQVPMQRGGGRLDQTINNRIEETWQRWCRADTCHTAGRLSFNEIERLVITAMAESGEVFIRLVPQAFGKGQIPFALEVIEADLLDEGKSHGPERDGSEWRMGVRVDGWGRPIEYAFLTRHPGDLTHGVGWRHRYIPANEILHLAILDRPGQTRGATWFAAAIKRLHHLAGYEEAEVVRARASSSLMGFITSPEGELVGDDVYDDERVSNFEPGVFKYLAPGEAVTVPQLDAPDGQFEPFMRAMLRAVAASIGCSYETVSRDFSQSNYSSSRLSLLEDRENWRQLQQYLIEHLHRPVYEAWLEAAVGSGVLPLPGYELLPERYQAVRWFPRGWGWVDPEKEINAYKEAVRCGFTTQAQIVAEQGGDLDDLMLARRAELDRAAELDLQFVTNPADDPGAQQSAPAAIPNQTGDTPTDTTTDPSSDVSAQDSIRAVHTMEASPDQEDDTAA